MISRLFRLSMIALAVLTGICLEGLIERFGGLRAVTFKIAKAAGIALPPEHDLSRLAWTHWDTRQFIIRQQLAETPAGTLLLLGDSVIEGLWTNRLNVRGNTCLAVNAGFAGIGVADLQRNATAILARFKPRFALLYVGINDAWQDADPVAWAAQYDALVGTIMREGTTPIVATIMPPESGFTTTTKSPETVRMFNQAIRSIAQRRGILVVDMAAARSEAEIQNTHLTVDGIHPTADFYREMVDRWIAPVLEAAQGVRGENCISSG